MIAHPFTNEACLLLIAEEDPLWVASLRQVIAKHDLATAVRVVAIGPMEQATSWTDRQFGVLAIPIQTANLARALATVFKFRQQSPNFKVVGLFPSTRPDLPLSRCEQAAWEAGIALAIHGRRHADRLVPMIRRLLAGWETLARSV